MSPISLKRRLVWAVLAALLGLGLIEGASAMLERTLLPLDRTIPSPSPVNDGAHQFNRAIDADYKARRARGDLPTQTAAPLPLVASKTQGWTMAPDQEIETGGVRYRSNTQGMRSAEVQAKEPGEIRLLTLGDSSVYGHGVPEPYVFGAIAAARLGVDLGRPTNIYNGAQPGHDSGQALATLREFGATISPDWVVVATLWSDIYHVRERNPFDPTGDRYLPGARDMGRRFATYRVIWRALGPWLASQQVRWMVSRDDIGALESPGGAGTTRTPLGTYVQNLRAMGQLARELGGRPVYLILSAPIDLDPVPPPDTLTAFRTAMRAVAEEQGAPLIDGPQAFSEAGASLGFFIDAVHPNREGHLVLGEALAAGLKPHLQP